MSEGSEEGRGRGADISEGQAGAPTGPAECGGCEQVTGLPR